MKFSRDILKFLARVVYIGIIVTGLTYDARRSAPLEDVHTRAKYDIP